MNTKQSKRLEALALRQSGLTQKQVAKQLNVGERTIRRWESEDIADTPNAADIVDTTNNETAQLAIDSKYAAWMNKFSEWGFR